MKLGKSIEVKKGKIKSIILLTSLSHIMDVECSTVIINMQSGNEMYKMCMWYTDGMKAVMIHMSVLV